MSSLTIQRHIQKLTTEKYCKESPLTICQSSYLTVGSLLNGFCAPTQDKLAIFYKQERMGLDGKPFMIWKFRSMRVNAESTTGPI